LECAAGHNMKYWIAQLCIAGSMKYWNALQVGHIHLHCLELPLIGKKASQFADPSGAEHTFFITADQVLCMLRPRDACEAPPPGCDEQVDKIQQQESTLVRVPGLRYIKDQIKHIWNRISHVWKKHIWIRLRHSWNKMSRRA
jgi:hypothetical protein